MDLGARTRTRTTRRHVALVAALLASVALTAVTFSGTGSAQPTATQGTRQFNIPAQALTDALVQFGYQSGLQVAADGNVAASVRSTAVIGSYAPADALGRMLAGTGLTFQFTSATTVQVQRVTSLPSGAMQLDPVQVQGVFPVPSQAMIDNLPPPYAGGQVATGSQLGLLGNRPVMDTPFNQTSYTAKKAQDQQAKTVRDVLVDDPSVRAIFPDGSAGVDNFRIRGFPVLTTNTAYGGLYGMLPTSSIMAELAERVELLKGPSAMLNGIPPNSNNLGGTINIVPKRAPNEPLTQITANYVSAGQVGGHVDVGRRFGSDSQVGARFNGVFRAGQTAVENNTDERALAILGLDFRGERVRLSTDFGYQYQYIGGLISYIALANNVPLPWAPNAYKNTGQPWNYQARKDLFTVSRVEFDLTERITAYAAFGAHDSRLEGLYSINLTTTNFYGAATAGAPFNLSQYGTTLTGEAGVRALVDTGPIGHEFALTGTTFGATNGSVSTFGAGFASNLYSPTLIARPGIAFPAATKTSTQGLSSFGFADTLSAADKRIQLTVGARLQQVTAANFDATTGNQTSSYDKSALSPAVALVFKPLEYVSVYGNFIQGLQQGTIVDSSFANAGQVFPPFVSTQYEAGVKVDWGKFTTSASLFQITQPFTFADVATNTLILGGEQRNQGLELNVFGEPYDGVRLLGGAMFMSPVLAKTQSGLTDGWIAPFSPTFQFNLAGEWDLPFAPGLTLNGRVIYTGSQFIDTTWPRRSLPEWTRFDLGMRYAFENPGAKGKFLVARLNVENVLDANYWAGGGDATTLMLGAPRTFRLSLTSSF